MNGGVRRLVSLSVVSHGQGDLVASLLRDLRKHAHDDLEILCTLNIPEAEDFLKDLDGLSVTVLRNASPMGFGANHNQAFRASRGDIFLIVNPDIRLSESGFPNLSDLRGGTIGAWAPRVIDSHGREQDNARRTPTFARLFRRRIMQKCAPDYEIGQSVESVDWVAGMFVAFPREAFAAVKGFDECYFMYMEDADICRRLRALDFDVVLDPSVTVIHDARRASRRDLRHILWHFESTFRFLCSG